MNSIKIKNHCFFDKISESGRAWSFFMVASLVNVFLTGIFLFVYPEKNPWEIIRDTALYSYLIPLSVYFFVTYFQVNFQVNFTWKTVLALLALMDIGVLIGNFAATTVSVLLCDRRVFSWSIYTESLLFSLFVSTMAVSFFYAYEFQRIRLQRALSIIKEKEVDEHVLKNLKSQAELQALQAKINPHFLFNTLNSIASLISIDPDGAEEAVEKLSNLFRSTLRNSVENEITLEEAVENTRSYLELEKLRLGNRLDYEFTLKGDLKGVVSQDLLIQPVVENSIKHGISPKIDGGKIWIEISVTDQHVFISVKDNGVGWEEKDSDSGHGLFNIQQRLELAFGPQNYELEIIKKDGVTVEIKLPRIK